MMDLILLEKIRKLAIQALVSDDELFEMLVLKGGNALDLIYKIADRASIDLDFSIEGTFQESRLSEIERKISELFEEKYAELDYQVYDVKLTKKPNRLSPELESFWGGYKITFKLISRDLYNEYKMDIDAVRRHSIPLGAENSTNLIIEISRYEYCGSKEERDFEGFMVKVYSPTLIAIEKLRAICQQMDEYKEIVPSLTRSPRARDFFDIYTIVKTCKIDILSNENQSLIKVVFDAKRVPINLVKKIEKYREYHRNDFLAVRDTVKPGVELLDYDDYFDYVKSICDEL